MELMSTMNVICNTLTFLLRIEIYLNLVIQSKDTSAFGLCSTYIFMG